VCCAREHYFPEVSLVKQERRSRGCASALSLSLFCAETSERILWKFHCRTAQKECCASGERGRPERHQFKKYVFSAEFLPSHHSELTTFLMHAAVSSSTLMCVCELKVFYSRACILYIFFAIILDAAERGLFLFLSKAKSGFMKLLASLEFYFWPLIYKVHLFFLS